MRSGAHTAANGRPEGVGDGRPSRSFRPAMVLGAVT